MQYYYHCIYLATFFKKRFIGNGFEISQKFLYLNDFVEISMCLPYICLFMNYLIIYWQSEQLS
jgi:hypothetical protein